MNIFVRLYPIMVVQSRYGGLYEDGEWHAIPNADAAWSWSDAYFEYVFGDDSDAIDFWQSVDAEKVGRGGTPNSAVLDLVKRHKEMRQLDYDDESRKAETEKGSGASDDKAGSETSGLLP